MNQRRWLEIGSAALVFILTWPVSTLKPVAGLDPSWQAGLHLSTERGLVFGRDVVFTYGPFGFLGVPRLFFPITALLGLIYVAVVHAGLCFTVVHLARRFLPAVVALIGAYVAVALVSLEPATVEAAEIVPIVMALWCVHAVSRGRRQHDNLRWWPWLLATAIAALQILVKFNTGVFCTVVLVVTAALVMPRRGWRLPAVLVGEFTGLLVALWLFAGAPLTSLPNFLRQSTSLTSGYSAAMAFEDASRGWEYVAVLVLAILTIATILYAGRRWPQHRWVAVLAVVAVAEYIAFRRGFVRHDTHAVSFFLAGALIPLAIRWPKQATVVGLALSGVWLLVLGAVVDDPVGSVVDPTARVTALGDQAITMLSPARRHRLEAESRTEIRATLNLGPRVLAEIGDKPVHIDPWETSAVWAYGFNWRPEPVFQSYLAYSPNLDQLNAEALAGPKGPERVLRQVPLPSIDLRHPLMEAPRAELALTCNYYEVVTEGSWEVLRKGPNRCLPARRIEEIHVHSGETTALPKVADNEMLVMHVKLGSSTIDKLRGALFKPARLSYVVLDDRGYQLVTANAEGPLLPCLPPVTGYPSAVSTPCPTSLAVVHDGSITIEFSAVPLA